MAETRTMITSDALFHALKEAGVLHRDERLTRIVIVATVGEPVVIHTQGWVDDGVLSVIPTLDGVEIRQEPGDS